MNNLGDLVSELRTFDMPRRWASKHDPELQKLKQLAQEVTGDSGWVVHTVGIYDRGCLLDWEKVSLRVRLTYEGGVADSPEFRALVAEQFAMCAHQIETGNAICPQKNP